MNSLAPLKARSAVPGTGELSQALEDARDREILGRFCSAHACTPSEVSEDGKRLSIHRVFDMMRTRGYVVSEPRRPQHQPRRGFVAWVVHIQTAKVEFDLAFYTPDTNCAGAKKKARARTLEHA